MTPETHAMLTEWLASGTGPQKAHAAHRLGLGDEIRPASPPRPFVMPPAFRRGWKACLYSTWQPGGCCGGALTCHWRGQVIPLATCVECLEHVT